jgi:alpha-tubulin suppressor-like RCC1 family protein
VYSIFDGFPPILIAADLCSGDLLMKFHAKPLSPLATFATALVVLVACQSTTEPTAISNDPVVATAEFPVNVSRIPDNTVWKTADTTASQKITCSETTIVTCTETFHLPHPLGQDSLTLELWTLGIRTSTLYFGQKGRSATLDRKSTILRDTLDTLLLHKYDSLPTSTRDSFSALGTGPSSLVAYYASLILSGNTAFAGKPLPVGMSADSVKKALVYLAQKSGLTASQLVTKNLGLVTLDSASVVMEIKILIKAGIFHSSDSSALFPPYPLRVKKALMVNGPLTAGESAVSVSGVFSWTKGRTISSPKFEVRTTKGVDPNFTFATSALPSNSDTTWILDSNLTVQAKSGAIPGTDTLVITLTSDSASVSARTTFQVVAKDTVTPSLRITSPSQDTTVSNSTASILIKASAWDSGSGLDSVKIGSAKHTSSPFSDSVTLAVGPNTVVVQAWDKAGNHNTDTVIVTRAKAPGDTVAPSLKITSPSKDTSVPYATTTIVVSATASDSGSGLDYILIAGTKLAAAPYSSDVHLAVGKDSILVEAWDKAGNRRADTIRVTRRAAPDTIPPALKITQPSKDTGVSNNVESITIFVTATDTNGIDSVKIGNFLCLTAPVSGSVNLAVGPNPIVVQAWDKSGNHTTDTVTVTRAPSLGDTVPPKIHRVSPAKDTSVLWATKSIQLSWTITDDSSLAKVTLDDSTLTGVGGSTLYQKTATLGVGANTFALMALDGHGNARCDTVRVTRSGDVTPPSVASSNGASPILLPNATSTFTAAWKVTDDVKMGLVTISDTSIAGTDNTYSLVVHLKVGTRKVGILASDSAGNKSTDTVVVIRSAAAPVHGSPTGNYIGTVYDTLVSAGADSIEVSTNGTDWSKYSGGVTVSGNGLHTVYARAWPGGALSSAVFTISQISKIAVGLSHAAIAKTDGSLWMTGKNNDGQLGTGDNIDVSTPVQVLASGVASVAAGNNHTLVLKKDGSLYGTGLNTAGQLGNGSTGNLSTLAKIADGVASVYAGLEHSLYITAGKVLMGSGVSNTGQLGAPTATAFTSFHQLDTGVTSAAAGQYHTMYLKGSGQLFGCGSNASGQLGRTAIDTQWTPILLDSNVSSISAGWNFSLRAKSSNTTLWGTGDDTYGQLGSNAFANVYTPIRIPVGPILAMATGWSHTLIATSDGSLYTMGDNYTGEAGGGSSGIIGSPTKIMSGVAQVFAGNRQSFVLKTDGTLWVSGRSTSGELGIGSLEEVFNFRRLNF